MQEREEVIEELREAFRVISVQLQEQNNRFDQNLSGKHCLVNKVARERTQI